MKSAIESLISAKREDAKRSPVEPAKRPRFSAPEQRQGPIVGLAIAALVPALFWTSLVAGASAMLGASVSTATLLTIGVVIAAFLTLVCAQLLRSEGAARRPSLHYGWPVSGGRFGGR